MGCRRAKATYSTKGAAKRHGAIQYKKYRVYKVKRGWRASRK